MKKTILLFTIILFVYFSGFAQNKSDSLAKNRIDTLKTNAKGSKKLEKIKKGWTFGAVPALAYDSDLGFRYGGLVNIYYFGDGSTYPRYYHSIYAEWSHTTKGSDKKTVSLDSWKLIPGVRFTTDVSYITEQGMDFYGFNGYESVFNTNLIESKGLMTYTNYNNTQNNDSLIGIDTTNFSMSPYRLFYKNDRKMLRVVMDFKGKLFLDKLQWLAGLGFYNFQIGKVDYNKLNEDKDAKEVLLDSSLYRNFVKWNVIDKNEQNGGSELFLKLGIVYDTRDNEPNPMKGIWSSLMLIQGHSFLDKDLNYTILALTHRQYFTLVKEVLNFGYRLNYQQKIAGKIPFYFIPFVHSSQGNPIDGLGGSQTIRGVLRNRVVGDGMAFGNFEMRWKFLRTRLLKQNFYIAFSAFADMGMVIDRYDLNTDNVPDKYKSEFFKEKGDGIHIGYGAGLHFAINQNFIIACDYGRAVKKEDGNSGIYIGLNFLF